MDKPRLDPLTLFINSSATCMVVCACAEEAGLSPYSTLKKQIVYNNPEKWVKTCAIQVTHMLGYNNR